MNPLITAIDREASSLPPERQRQVLDFIGYLRARNEPASDPVWLERAWGAAPGFPERLPQAPLADLRPL